MPDLTSLGQAILVTPPIIEPIDLSSLKLHLRLDSGNFASNIDETILLPPASHAVNAGYTLLYELLTLDVAPGGGGWVAGDTITGQTSTKTCKIVEVLTTITYTVRDRSGTFTLGEILSNGVATADQGALFPTFTPAKVEVLGYSAVVVLESGTFTTGTLDCKIQDSDDGITWVDWTGGAFTQVTNANDNATQEIAYTGTKRYIRVAAKVLVAACPFSVTVIRLAATAVEDDLLNSLITTAREEVEYLTQRALLTQTWDYIRQEWPDTDYIRLPFGNLKSLLSLTISDSSCVESDGTYDLIFTGTNKTPATGTYTILANVITAVTLTSGGTGYVTAPTVATQTGDGSVTASMVSVKWKDTAGIETTLIVGTDYLVETNGEQCGRIVLPYGKSWPTTILYPSNPITIRFVCGWTAAALVPYKIKAAIKMICSKLYEGRGEDVLGQTVHEDATVDRLLIGKRLWDNAV